MSVGTDRHANARDRKRERRAKSRAMRGNRSVFVIRDTIEKRGKAAKRQRLTGTTEK